MDRRIKIYAFCLVLAFPFFSLDAQDNRLDYWGDVNRFMDNQSYQTFLLIDRTLSENPPQIKEPSIRKIALYALDGLLHDPRLDNSDLVYAFLRRRIQRVAEELKEPAVSGMKIYKLYNHSFIVRTPSVTIGFDLVRGGKESHPFLPDTLMKKLVDACDYLFVTHLHEDHADLAVARMFSDRHKTVYAPTGLWENVSTYIQPVVPGEIKEFDHSKLKQIRVMPGHQGEEVPNNVYILTTADDFTVAHTGDQSREKDFEWISQIKNYSNIDVLLVNSWTNNMEATVNGFNPRIVIPGHENELGHSIDHREPYWLTYRRLQTVNHDYIVMTWGESFLYKKNNF